jgi:hypothetical protein
VANAKVTDTITLTNSIIYAKRIEQGWSHQTPAGVYQPTRRWAHKLFGDSFSITFGYAPLRGAGINKVRRYDFPKVRPGTHSAGITRGFSTGQSAKWSKGGKLQVNQRQRTSFVVKHGAAASTFGYQMVDAVFPFISIRAKELGVSIAKGSTKRKIVGLR